jgi:hypothetical protein
MIEEGLSLLFAGLIASTAQAGEAAAAPPPPPPVVWHHYNPRWQEQAFTYRCDEGMRRLVAKETFNVKAQFVSAVRSGRRVPPDQLQKATEALQGVLFWQVKPMCHREGDLLILTGVKGRDRVQVMLIWTDNKFEVGQFDILK